VSRAAVTLAALGHDPGKAVVENEKAATCTEAGSYDSVVYCTECGVELSRETVTVEALGHDFEVYEIVPPTCNKSGYTVYKCSRCDKTYKDDPVEPEHQWDEGTVTAPTCTEKGFTTYTCLICELEYVDEASWTDALGHDFVNGECSRCDAEMDAAFEDVPVGSFYFDPVQWAVDEEITAGTTPTTFDPNGKCMRAVVVTFLWKAAGSPEPKTTENPFTDVKEGSYYYKAVLWAYENNVTAGLTATTFGPTALCNRAQVVTFLYNAMGKPEVKNTEHKFTDVDEGKFYYTPMLWAVENGITAGLTETTFGPNAICNRAQVVTFLYRLYNK
jgi:DNA-directed RNA polymerase subunit RPC12/RpoP